MKTFRSFSQNGLKSIKKPLRFSLKSVTLFATTKKQTSKTLIKPVDYDDFLPPEFRSDPKKYKKALGFSLKMTT